jgi:signal transduction histidine kinase
MPDGGTLALDAHLSSSTWSVTFTDEGRGMTAEEQGRLFTPFAHSLPGGTGLGLAIVYRIVEEHGGTIRVRSAPGEGTAITLSLPLAGPGERKGMTSGERPAARPGEARS